MQKLETVVVHVPAPGRRIGLVFVYPWNSEGGWRWPSFTRWSENGGPMKAVAVSFNRAAIVFDITWYLRWMKSSV